jgi:hypothetical protein
MTRDEIIKLAVQCQLVTEGTAQGIYMEALERFATLVSQAENESCVEALRKEYMTGSKPTFLRDLEKAVRARWKE